MSAESPLEQRLAAMEAAIADLQRQLNDKFDARNWLDKVAGSFKDEPEFAKVVAYGREFRHADRPAEEAGS
jgi:hypothetical protein